MLIVETIFIQLMTVNVATRFIFLLLNRFLGYTPSPSIYFVIIYLIWSGITYKFIDDSEDIDFVRVTFSCIIGAICQTIITFNYFNENSSLWLMILSIVLFIIVYIRYRIDRRYSDMVYNELLKTLTEEERSILEQEEQDNDKQD